MSSDERLALAGKVFWAPAGSPHSPRDDIAVRRLRQLFFRQATREVEQVRGDVDATCQSDGFRSRGESGASWASERSDAADPRGADPPGVVAPGEDRLRRGAPSREAALGRAPRLVPAPHTIPHSRMGDELVGALRRAQTAPRPGRPREV